MKVFSSIMSFIDVLLHLSFVLYPFRSFVIRKLVNIKQIQYYFKGAAKTLKA